MGGSDEQIAEAAVHLHMARCLPGVGSSPAEVGAAVVEALRLCGRLPNPADAAEALLNSHLDPGARDQSAVNESPETSTSVTPKERV